MKKITFNTTLWTASVLLVMPCQAAPENTFIGMDSHTIRSAIAAYSKPSDQVIYHKEHLYVFNGMTSVGLEPKQFGVHRLVAPPFVANPFNADLRLFGRKVAVRDYQWYPSQARFTGEATTSAAPPAGAKKNGKAKKTL
jgi:hypothetical protein